MVRKVGKLAKRVLLKYPHVILRMHKLLNMARGEGEKVLMKYLIFLLKKEN